MDKQKVVFSDSEKLDYFIKRVSELAHSDEKKIRSSIERDKEAFFSKALKELEDEIENHIRETRSKINSEIDIKRSKILLEQKHELVRLREKFRNDLFVKLKERVKGFTNSAQYPEFLKKLAAKAYETEKKGVILLSPSDMKYAEEIKEYLRTKYGVSLEILEEKAIELGGLRLFNDESGVMINETLESRIERALDEVELDDLI